MNIVDEALGGRSPESTKGSLSIVDEALRSTAPVKGAPQGFAGEVGTAIKRRFGGIADELFSPVYGNVLTQGPQKLFRAAGEAGGLIGDVALSGLKSAYQTLTPDLLQKGLSSAGGYLANTDIGKAQLATLGDIGKLYGAAQERFPEGMKNVEAGINIAGAIPIVKGAAMLRPALKEGAAIAGDIGRAALSKTPVQAAEKVDTVIRKGITKGIRPTVVGKANAGQITKYYNNAYTAVKTILRELPGELPQSLDDFSTAIREAKKKVYEKYSALSEAAGEKGVMADLSGTRKELFDIDAAPNTPLSVKNAAKKATEEISAYSSKITPAQAEDLVAHINTLTKPFWNNPNPSEAHFVTMLERVARNVRKAASDAVDSIGGAQYSGLKKEYGALSTIEKDVAHRAVVDARKNAKGIFDLADVATAAEFATGIMSMNPFALARATAMQATKAYIKGENNPNNIIKKMFEQGRRLIDGPNPTPFQSQALKKAASVRDSLTALERTPAKALAPSLDAPLQYPPVPSSAIRLPSDVSKLNELDRLIAERTAVPKTRLPGAPTLIDLAPRPPQLRPNMAAGDLIIPGLLERYKNQLPTWIEDRLNELRTGPEAAWNAQDRAMIKTLIDGETAKRQPLIKPATSYSRRGGAPAPENIPQPEAPGPLPKAAPSSKATGSANPAAAKAIIEKTTPTEVGAKIIPATYKAELPKFESSELSRVVKKVDQWIAENTPGGTNLKDGIGTNNGKIVWKLKDGRLIVVESDISGTKTAQAIKEVSSFEPYPPSPKTVAAMRSRAPGELSSAKAAAKAREEQSFRETQAKFADEAANTETISQREARRLAQKTVKYPDPKKYAWQDIDVAIEKAPDIESQIKLGKIGSRWSVSYPSKNEAGIKSQTFPTKAAAEEVKRGIIASEGKYGPEVKKVTIVSPGGAIYEMWNTKEQLNRFKELVKRQYKGNLKHFGITAVTGTGAYYGAKK